MNPPSFPPPWTNGPVSYETRIVAYFDVLGWKHIIEQAGTDPVALGKLRSLVGLYGHFQQKINEDMQGSALSAFSDNVVVSQRFEDESVQDFMDTMGRFQFAAALQGFYIRGAITVGDLFHDQTSVFGPALIRAYQLESQQAKNPRIIIDPDNMDVLGSSRRMRIFDGFSTIDTFGAEFVQKCATPTVAAASSSSSTRPVSSRMMVVPTAQPRIILAELEANLTRAATEPVQSKLVWLKSWIESGIAEMEKS